MQPFRAAVLGLAALALLAAPSNALLIATPLTITVDPGMADNGATVTLTIDPANGTDPKDWAGAALDIHFEANGANDTSANGTAARVVLDANAHAVATWHLPRSTDDTNVILSAQRDGQSAAIGRLRVGDAPPIMYSHTAGGDPVPPPAPGPSPAPSPGPSPSGATARTPGLEAGLAAVGVAGIALAARRR
jgi:hypothetical protein